MWEGLTYEITEDLVSNHSHATLTRWKNDPRRRISSLAPKSANYYSFDSMKLIESKQAYDHLRNLVLMPYTCPPNLHPAK